MTDLTLGSSLDSNLTLSWTQEVPYPGKRRLAGDVARAGVEVSARMLEAARVRVRSEIKAAYADLLRIDRTREVINESRKLLATFLDTARVRYETGEGILENVLKSHTELTKIDAELVTIAQARRSAEVSLQALLGRTEDSPLGPAIAVPRLAAADPDALEHGALERSPEIQGLRAMAHKESGRLSLAERNLKPDFMWGAAYVNRGGLDPMVMGMFGIRLPLYRKQKQAEAVVEAGHELEAAQYDLRAREVDLRAEIRDLVARTERASTLITLYEEGILPQSRSALDSAAASYAVGRSDFLTLLDDFLTVLRYEVDIEAQRAEKIKALAALEPLTGIELVHLPESGAVAPAEGGSHD